MRKYLVLFLFYSYFLLPLQYITFYKKKYGSQK